MKKSIFYFILVFIIPFHSNGQSFDPALAGKLQNTLDSLRASENIQGISASVYYPGQGLWKGVAGESHAGVPITSGMLFHIASNTKTFTAVMFLKLVENNIVSLDDSLHLWLPSYNINIDSNITVRQMLNHTSGIANTFDVPGFIDSLMTDPNRIFTPEEILSWLSAAPFAPDAGQRYSNPNYNLIALVMESATGQEIEQLMRDSIFIPLNLDSTFFPIYDTLQGTVANPWVSGVDWDTIPRTSLLSANWAAGAIYSTSGEMAQWYNSLFNNNFLEPEELNEMMTVVGPQKRGIGIQQIEMGGRTIWGHGGSTLGYSSIIVYDTTFQAVIVVLINEGDANQFLVAEELLLTLMNNPISGIDNINERPRQFE